MAGWLSMPCQVWPGASRAAHRSTPHVAAPTAIVGFCLRLQRQLADANSSEQQLEILLTAQVVHAGNRRSR